MKILSLKVKNFRQFYGEQKIEFSTDSKKNITLIHAENGVGKTALLNAIKWCFFKQTTHNFSEKNKLLNHYAKDNNENSYSVTIEFEDDDEYYTCERGFNSFNKDYFTMTMDDRDTGYRPISDAELFINSIIPKDMSEYFFFQGEGVGRFTKVASGHNTTVKEAIHNVLGFKIAKQAIDDLGDIKKDYRREISQRNKDSELSKLHDDLAQLEQSETDNNTRYNKCLENITMYEGKIAEIDEKLLNGESTVIKQNQQNRSKLTRRHDNINTQIRNKNNEKRRLMKTYGPYVFAKKLASQALDFINEEEFNGTIPAPYNENLVRKILEQKECICGAEISSNSQAYNNISKLLENAADPEQGNRVIRARETLKSIQTKNQDSHRVLLSNRNDLAELQRELEDVEKELEEISLTISELNIDDISALESKRNEYKDHSSKENRLMGSLEHKREITKSNIKAKLTKLKQLKAESTGMDIYQESLEILTQVEQLLTDTLATAEENSFKDLSKLINDTLDKYVRQDFKAKIDKDTFNIRLIDKQNRLVAMSDGQQLLLSLTFISSLIELAARRKDAKGEILTPGVIAPFVIDAPFGVLDNTYKGNMAKSIPDSVEQVVLLLSSSHWEGTVEENIRDSVGKEYNLVAEVNAPQGIKTLNPLNIMGKEYDTVRYGCPINMTIIEEIAV